MTGLAGDRVAFACSATPPPGSLPRGVPSDPAALTTDLEALGHRIEDLSQRVGEAAEDVYAAHYRAEAQARQIAVLTEERDALAGRVAALEEELRHQPAASRETA